MTDPAPARGPWLAPLLLLGLGAFASLRLTEDAPSGSGAARLSDPEVLLATFDAAWVLLAAIPVRDPRSAPWAAATVVAIGLPFHLAVAAAAGAAPGHLAAVLLLVVAFAASGWAASGGRATLHAAGLALLTLGVPLAAYAIEELLGVRLRHGLAASPLTGPALLGGVATTTAWTAALPGVTGALVLVGLARWPSSAGKDAA